MKDLYNNVVEEMQLIPAVITADAVSTGVDLQDFESVDLCAILGNSADTLSGSVYIDLILEHSDTLGSGYTAVTDAYHVLGLTVDSSGIFATINAPAEDSRVFTIGYRGPKQFARISIDLTGSHSSGIPVSVMTVKSAAKVQSAR